MRHPQNEAIDEGTFIDRCMSYGKQAYLQRRISSEASIGKLLYANAWKMLMSRGLIHGAEGRLQQAEALNQLIRRLEVIRAMSIADRGASTLGMWRVERSKVAILGGGSWGTTTASVISRQCDALLWARDGQIVAEINEQRTNQRYLGDAPLNPKLAATTDIGDAVKDAKAVLIAVPSSHFREVLTSALADLPPGIPIISLSKGLEKGSRMRMTEIIREVAPGRIPGVLTGPNLAR